MKERIDRKTVHIINQINTENLFDLFMIMIYKIISGTNSPVCAYVAASLLLIITKSKSRKHMNKNIDISSL